MIVLTFDTDWAPVFIIDYVVQKLQAYNFKATFFCTNPLNYEFNDCIECGIHPNFMSDSTQGNSEDGILDNLLQWFPTAQGVRTHRLYYYSGLNAKFGQRGLLYDSSVFLPFHPYLEPTKIQNFIRIPYWWSDNVHLYHNLPLNTIELPNLTKPGLKVFNFHPIHVYLNTKSMEEYAAKIRQLQPFVFQFETNCQNFFGDGYGIGAFFESLLEYIHKHQKETFSLREQL